MPAFSCTVSGKTVTHKVFAILKKCSEFWYKISRTDLLRPIYILVKLPSDDDYCKVKDFLARPPSDLSILAHSKSAPKCIPEKRYAAGKEVRGKEGKERER